MTRFYISKNGQETGPFTETEVKSLLQSGSVGRNDLFRQEGAQSWLPLSDFGAASAAPTPTATAPGNAQSTRPQKSHGAAKTIAILILLLLLLIGGCRFLRRSHSKPDVESSGAPGPTPAPGPAASPQPIVAYNFPEPSYEKWFIENIEPFKTRYPASRTDDERNSARGDRALGISHALPGRNELVQWGGVLRKVSPTLNGKLAVVIEIHDSDFIQTWPDPVSDAGANTLIDKDSDLYKRVRAIPIDTPVLFDFDLIEDKNDWAKEGSKTVLEGMVAPKFIVHFKDIKGVSLLLAPNGSATGSAK